jgi:hypothetical protein
MPTTMPKSLPTIHTVGHSTHTLDELVEMPRAHGVRRLVDVRTTAAFAAQSAVQSRRAFQGIA